MRTAKWLTCLILLLVLSSPTAHAGSLNILDDRGEMIQKVSALSKGGEMLVDLYDFFRALDFTVSWDPSTERLDVKRDEIELRFQPDSSRVYAGEQLLNIPAAPTYREGRLFLDAGSAANLLNRYTGESMIWNPARGRMRLARSEAWAQESESEDPIGKFLEEKPPSEDGQFLVVVDPGHGGRDPGAVGANGLREKQVVLRMARALQDYLREQHPEIETRLTRKGDRFLALKSRTQIANEMDADLFISIHANSGHSSYASGFEVFTLSGEATDPNARDLAEIENSALLYEGYDKKEIDDLSFILWQLRSTVHTRESQKVARLMLEEMEDLLPISNRGMKQAPFWVLKDAQMPAVLVETGFLSNPSEEKRLQSREYHRRLARALGPAISKYRKQRF